MNYLIPGWELGESEKKHFRMATAEALQKMSLRMGITRDQDALTIRKLELTDLGLENWTIKPHRVGSQEWINHCSNGNQLYGIYKITMLSLDPTAQHLKIRRNGNWAFSADLSEMYASLNILKVLYQSDADTAKITEELEGRSGTLEKIMQNKSLQCEAYLTEPIIVHPNEWIAATITRPTAKTHLSLLAL